MTWQTLPPDIRAIAEAQLTKKQLHVWLLHLNGIGVRRSAVMLTVTPTTIRDHLDAAHRTLRKHGVSRQADGSYQHERKDAE